LARLSSVEFAWPTKEETFHLESPSLDCGFLRFQNPLAVFSNIDATNAILLSYRAKHNRAPGRDAVYLAIFVQRQP
jgi:hypothetical protein